MAWVRSPSATAPITSEAWPTRLWMLCWNRFSSVMSEANFTTFTGLPWRSSTGL